METFQSEYAAHDRTCARCRPNHTVTLKLHHAETKFVNLRTCSANEGPVTVWS